eukprot:CAMPEP_0113652670 /NCGR_PEP_ID=MMETSP0017_2-20120614/28144_1 /TAXON_ID=2856 /ORGANISM="Cylindrotheca closterium" /LENGTH=657 /DNA_ID=CAMNT_0000565561 /DNA_START=153 /DNA_END=2126 /DNA_ORIENTATION=- /assembly_acc=CAM_ASM_000147
MDNQGGCFQRCLCFDDERHASSIPVPSLNVQNDTRTRREMKSTEDFLASEMNKLSVQERSKALDELHCVGEELKETPEMIETSLAEFDKVLRERNEPIYNLATSQNRSYVEDPSFRLRFLRANLHDVHKSVNQMIGFLSRKEMYFGRDKIARDITLDDLEEDDIELLLSGLYHIQDGTDRSGRVVVCFLNHLLGPSSNKSIIRVNYFVFFNILSKIPAVQTKGIVLCFYDMSAPMQPVQFPSPDKVLKGVDAVTKVPVRRSAVHFCLKAVSGILASNNIVLEGILKGFQRSFRTRARLHYGSDIELQYELRSYGLNPETFPVDTNGNLRQDILNVWFDNYLFDQWNGRLASASHKALSVPEPDMEEMFDEGSDHIIEHNWNTCLGGDSIGLAPSPTDPISAESVTHNNPAHFNSTIAADNLDEQGSDHVMDHSWNTLIVDSMDLLTASPANPMSLESATTDMNNPGRLNIASPAVVMDEGKDHAFELHNWNTSSADSVGAPTPTDLISRNHDESATTHMNNNPDQHVNDSAASPAVIAAHRTPSRCKNSTSTADGSIEPGTNDVLFGMGRGFQNYSGNIRFREFLKNYQDEYNNAQRYKRLNTPKELTRVLLDSGMRFLRKTKSGDGWEECEFSEVEKKVKQAFRTRKTKMLKNIGT